MPWEVEGFRDLGGYFSKKAVPERSTLASGDFDKDVFVASDWINMRNWGYLNTPDHKFVDDLIELDKAFRKFHEDAPGDVTPSFKPNDLSRLPNVTKDFAAKIKANFPNYPDKFYMLFSRTRSFARKRILNQAIYEQQTFRGKRKMLEYTDTQKQSKKGKEMTENEDE